MSMPHPLAAGETAPPESNPAQWFAEEVYSHDAHLKAHLRGCFPSLRGDVEDVVQDSYLRIWKARAVEPIRSARSMLFVIARRLALNVVRRNRRSPVTSVEDLAAICPLDNTAAVSDLTQEVKILAEAVAALPPRCREVFVMRRLQGVSTREVAQRLGLSEHTVQVQVSRGLRKCEAYLLEHLKS